MVKAKPFVKWAGGKASLLTQLERLLPNNFDEFENVTYIEPFVGGGAMLFHMLRHHTNITRAVINDVNKDLIHCYELIRDNPLVIIEQLEIIEKLYNSYDQTEKKLLYYNFREKYNEEHLDSDEKAALFLFLNHTCFNGLFRVNNQGKFNVPYGSYKHTLRFDTSVIWEDHKLLNGIKVIIKKPGDYQEIRRNLSRVGKNFIYLDPPYRPMSTTSNFKGYSRFPFDDFQQEELKMFCDYLWKKDCLIMLSNSDSKTKEGESYFELLYDNYNFVKLYAPRCINAFPNKRVKTSEVLIRNYLSYEDSHSGK